MLNQVAKFLLGVLCRWPAKGWMDRCVLPGRRFKLFNHVLSFFSGISGDLLTFAF